MNKNFQLNIIAILLVLFSSLGAIAQPTLVASDETVPSGSITKVDISVMDFTDITKTQFSLSWNPAELEFISIQDINSAAPLNLTNANLDVSDAANGNIVFTWTDMSGSGITVDDGMRFFAAEFRALIPEGQSADIVFSDMPTAIIINRNASGNTNIFDPSFVENSTITTTEAIPDVFINLVPQEEKTIFCKGDQICYDLTVADFDSILGMQFIIKWQGSVLEYDRVENFGLNNFNENTFNVTTVDSINFIDSIARALWQPLTAEELTNGATLEDGSTLMTVCFNVVGAPNSETLIEITEDVNTPQEIFNYNGIIFDIVPQNQTVTVSDCANLVVFSTSCPEAIKDDTICVDITAGNFNNISETAFNLSWESSILEFVGTNNYNLPGLQETNFNINNGSLVMDWTDPDNDGETLDESTPLFTACFKVTGDIDSTGFISFLTEANTYRVIDSVGNRLDDIRFNDCSNMKVLPPKVVLSAPMAMGPPNEMICVPITVDQFLNINHIEMPIEWEPTILEFVSTQSYGLPNLGITNFDVSDVANGKLQLTGWDSPTNQGESLAGNSTLFEICFNVKGVLGDQSPLVFPNTINDPVFIRNNNNQEPGVIINNGSVEVTSAGLVLASDATEIEQNESACVDIRVSNFQQVTTLKYAHTWDPTVLRFDSIGSIAFDGLTTDNFTIGPDSISINFNSATGATLEDGAVLYSLCFTAIGDLGACSNFTIKDAPEVISLENPDQNIGIFNNTRDICVNNFGLTNIVIEAPSCKNEDGFLRLDVSGDPGNTYVYQISKDGVEFINNADTKDSIHIKNLAEGEYCLNIFSINTAKNLNRCFTIKIKDDEIPIPMAGPDIDLGCIDLNNLEHQIDGNVIVSGIFSYNWTALNGGQIKAQNEDVEDPIITAPGTYILTIETPKCTASDTVEVFASTPPVVEVEPVDILGCTNSTTQLNAGNSQIGENQIGFWTTDIGHFVSDSTSVTPVVDQEGTYTFTILDTLNGCKSSANVLVQVNTAKPKADAGQDRQLGCEDPFITLSGLSSSSGTGIAYEWSTPDGSSIVNFDKIEADVSRVGTYILKVTNLINGCQATDTMMVLADESLPVARIGKEAFIGCGMDEVTLDATNSSQGRSFKYRWETSGQFLSDTNFITTQDAGQFLFIVTNIDNDDCIADTARIDVKIDKNAPESSITQQLTLGCKSECTDLSANIPAEGQEFFTYQWTTDDGLICEGENMPTAKVSSVALYKFIITDTRNNCSDTSSAIVAGDASSIISDAGPSRIIGCDRDPVLLDGRGSTVNDNTTITWTDEAGTVISDQITAEVNQPGTYLLTIVDKVTDCNASNKVEVTLDTMPPLANAGEDLILEGCEFPNSLRLNGSLSESGPGISYAWVAPLGGKLTGDSTSISPAIGGPGIYQLTVTNNNTGCSSTDEVQIQSKLNIPSPNGGPDRTLSCDEPMTTLAGLSGLPSGNATIKWSTQDGNIVGVDDQLSLQVDAAGTYVLSITSQDGCTSTDEVVVTADLDMPNADAGAPLTISCNENTLLNGSGSTGPNLEISWTTTNGNIVSGADTYTPEVNLGGTYTLTVSNLDNNCKTTSEVLITADDPLPLAVAGDNQEICGNETSLSATPVDANIQGKWSTLEKSIILSESDPNTSVADLVEGANTYIWTLSTDKCPDYSSDTVRVTVPGFPVATDDAFEIVNGQNTPTLNLIANDIINFEAYNVNIVVQPTTGELMKESEGQYTFSTPARFYGTQEFQYEVCSAICSELCDQASVRVVVLPSDDVDTTNSLPNAITPNGDGLNDMLIFDELIFDASSFPKSELVIFNRWGDVVYKASPYNNDWGGKTTNGDVLPEGTYYFVLRLDIAEGEGMKGDVTILR